ncbi:Autophagy-related protein 2 [Frankliniella fusca]|uniref:Autophagy-related protein 2 n=1 Tax=Frankliniella fusca TaxID=407009 RepID=A0AAE1H0G5_9NEOP|nr:Autophagy-related protein 2 [Frankliniella fusca]
MSTARARTRVSCRVGRRSTTEGGFSYLNNASDDLGRRTGEEKRGAVPLPPCHASETPETRSNQRGYVARGGKEREIASSNAAGWSPVPVARRSRSRSRRPGTFSDVTSHRTLLFPSLPSPSLPPARLRPSPHLDPRHLAPMLQLRRVQSTGYLSAPGGNRCSST